MAIKPSERWRQSVAREAAQVAAGTLDPGDAFAAKLFPVSLLESTDRVLGAFEAEVAGFGEPSDDDVMGAVERVVLQLNEVNEEHDGAGYETDERERLCTYIDEVLHEAGVDVTALAERRGMNRWELTDEWRDW